MVTMKDETKDGQMRQPKDTMPSSALSGCKDKNVNVDQA